MFVSPGSVAAYSSLALITIRRPVLPVAVCDEATVTKVKTKHAQQHALSLLAVKTSAFNRFSMTTL